MSRRQKTTRRPLTLRAGMFALLGYTSASYPNDWCLGEILGVFDNNVVVSRSDMTGTRKWLEVASVHDVRAAAGTIKELVSIRAAAAKAVERHRRRIQACEQRLGAARDALWAALKRLADEGVAVVPLDRRALRQHHVEQRHAHNLFDIQDRAARDEIERITGDL